MRRARDWLAFASPHESGWAIVRDLAAENDSLRLAQEQIIREDGLVVTRVRKRAEAAEAENVRLTVALRKIAEADGYTERASWLIGVARAALAIVVGEPDG